MTYQEIRYDQLRAYEKKGRQLEADGITLEYLEELAAASGLETE